MSASPVFLTSMTVATWNATIVGMDIVKSAGALKSKKCKKNIFLLQDLNLFSMYTDTLTCFMPLLVQLLDVI